MSLSGNNTTNLRIFNQSFSNPNPTTIGTDLTLNFDIDYLTGLYSSNQTFTIENVKNSIFYLVLPNDISLMNDSVLKISCNYFVPQTSETKETVKTTEFELTNTQIIGQIIRTSFNTDFKLDSTFRGFNLNISKLSTPNTEAKVDKFDITITDANGSFYLKTYPLLSTQFTQYQLENRIGNIRYHRGFNFVYSQNKYSFLVNYKSSFTPGVYVKIGLTVVGKGLKMQKQKYLCQVHQILFIQKIIK